jgi:DNA-binding NarL/FixJ family response regulator
MKTLLLPKIQKRKSKIFIVDDHPLICEGLTRLINQQSHIVVCGKAATTHQALRSISALKPDVVIVDLTLKNGSGMDLIKDMNLKAIKSSVLVLSMHDESLYAERALRAGAKGYIMKQEASKETLKAINVILKGEIYLSNKIKAKLLHMVADNRPTSHALPIGGLSDRELRVFELIGQGRSTGEIAKELHISVKTVESYRGHIKLKMSLKNAHELTQHAVHWVETNHLN